MLTEPNAAQLTLFPFGAGYHRNVAAGRTFKHRVPPTDIHDMHRPIFLVTSCCALIFALSCLSASAQEGSVGIASFYAKVPDRSEKFTAAHRTLPFGTMVSVTRIDTGAHVVVRINDRGPFIKGRIIDVSLRAAEQLGMIGAGVARVKLEVVDGAAAQKIAIARPTCEACELARVDAVD